MGKDNKFYYHYLNFWDPKFWGQMFSVDLTNILPNSNTVHYFLCVLALCNALKYSASYRGTAIIYGWGWHRKEKGWVNKILSKGLGK